MDPITLGIIALTFLALISPLLTFAALFQQKEWRVDRLLEHLRRDGWVGQLLGKSRVTLGAVWILGILTIRLAVVSGLTPISLSTERAILFQLLFLPAALAAMTVIQILLKKQRTPVWTQKAKLLLCTSIILNIGFILFCLSYEATGYDKPGNLITLQPYQWITWLVPYLQPLILILAWVAWKPVDLILKQRIMNRAMQHRSQMKDATVIGIAGSVGKTTVKELIAHLLQDLNPTVTPAHVNTEMGVAQWLLRQPATSFEDKKLREENSQLAARSSKLLIVEMGAYRKGEIVLLCRIAQPTIGVVTALGSDHLALFGSEQNIIDANGELIDALPKNGHAFFYGDNEGCKELTKRAPCPVTIAKAGTYKHQLEGRHNDCNVSLAVAVAAHLGIKNERATELLQTFKPQAHTFSVKTERGVTVLDDTYNISPLSFGAALDWAAKQKQRPRVLLTSGLQETGSAEKRFLQELGAKASDSIERVIFTNKHGADVFAKAYGKPVEVLGKKTACVDAGSILLAVGRMPLSTVTRLLPHAEGMHLS